MSAIELSSHLLNQTPKPLIEGKLQGRSVENQTGNPSRFALNAHRFGLYFLSFLCAAGGIALIATAATGLIPWPFAMFSLNLFTFSAILYCKAGEIHDYNHPKELAKLIEKAKSQPMEKLLRLHGADNLRKYGIVPESRFEEHEKTKQALRDESTFQGKKREQIDQETRGRKERLLNILRSSESAIHNSSYSQHRLIVDSVYSEAGIYQHEKGSDFALPYWARQKMSQKLKEQDSSGEQDLQEIQSLRARVKKDPGAAELQRRYDKEIRAIEKDCAARRKRVEAGEVLDREIQPVPATEPTELQKQVEELGKRHPRRWHF